MQTIPKKLRILCIFFFTSLRAFTQHLHDTTGYHLLVKVDFSNYLLSYFPHHHVDLDFSLGKKWAINLGGGPLSDLAIPARINGATALDRSGFVLRPALKYFFRPDHPHNNLLFVSADFFYREAHFRVVESYTRTSANQTINYADTIRVHHHARGFTFNLGQMISFGRWGLEVSVGFGLRFIRQERTEEIFPYAEYSSKERLHFWRRDAFIVPRFGDQIKVYYRF